MSLFGKLYAVLLLVLAVFPPFLWWRGGMWDHGELPTHGMLNASGSALAALAFYLIFVWLKKRNQT